MTKIRVSHDANVTDEDLAYTLLERVGGNRYGDGFRLSPEDGSVVYHTRGYGPFDPEDRYDEKEQWRRSLPRSGGVPPR